MKKILCLLLAALMLLSTVACATTNEDNPDDTEAGTKAPGETEAETQDMSLTLELPKDLDYGNTEVNILYCKASAGEDELVSDGSNDIVPSAVHERNVMVQDLLKVKLTMIPRDDATQTANALRKDNRSGDGEFPIVSNGTYLSVQPAIDGNYLDLNRLDNIDPSKRYWTQGYNDMVTFTDDKMQFLVSGPIAISMSRLMYLTLYNKDLFKDLQVPDLYETVKNGQWTLDYQYSITQKRYIDEDGDGLHSEGDFYGFVTGNIISVDPYMVATDIHMITKDAETGDLMYNSEAQAKLIELCDKVQLLYNDDSTYQYKTADKDDVPYNFIIQHFTNKKAMMITTMFWKMETNFADLSALTYGIAPMPKFNEAQESYYSYVQDQVSCYGISRAVDGEETQEMCAAILEAMAYYSYNTVRPAYYETALSERYMQDPQSKDVLDTIFDTLYFDFSSSCSNIFTACVIRDNLRPLLSGTTNTISSATASWSRSIDKALQNYNKKLDKLRP